MSNKSLTLAIVIPVYNEQNYLAACLDSIAAQSIRPNEVIVVDNNSTDDTVEIANSYSFVKLISETNQHQSFAQKTGFDAANSDIIGRIDADSVLPVNWVKNVKNHFENNPQTVGVTGGTKPYDMSSAKAGSFGFRFFINLASGVAGTRMLWGANCAVRKSAWEQISGKVLTRGDIWEDYDLAFCIAPYGQISMIDSIDIDSSFRSIRKPLITQTRYQFRAVRTFYFRTSLARTALFFSAWTSLFLLFIPVMIDKYILVPAMGYLRSGKARSNARDIVQLESE